MKRKFLVLIIITILLLPLIMLFVYGCALQDWITAGQNIDKLDPKWDTSVRVPVLQKTIELKDYLLPNVNIDPYVMTVGGLPFWPLNVDGTQDLSGNVPLGITIDFDSNASNDIDLRGLYCRDIDVTVQVWLEGVSTTKYLIDPADLVFDQIKIEGVTYMVENPPTVNGNILEYKLQNFLSPAEDYYMDFGGDAATNYNQVDFEEFDLGFKGSPTPDHSTDADYTFMVNVLIDLGNDYGIAGQINNSAVLLEGNDEAIPIDQIPMGNLEGFEFEFLFESRLSFDLTMDMLFKGDTTPVPDTHAITILSGNLTENTQHSYWYASGLRNTEDDFAFTGNVLDYGNLTMDYSVNFPPTTGVILFKTSDYIIVNMDIYIAKATIDL